MQHFNKHILQDLLGFKMLDMEFRPINMHGLMMWEPF